ncbi:MAG: MerR family DNA-binding protein, partial [Dermatophilaceae bacterium]
MDDIRELLAVRDSVTCPCEPADQLLRRRLAQLDAELARLVALRQNMADMLQALAGADCPLPAPGT